MAQQKETAGRPVFSVRDEGYEGVLGIIGIEKMV